MSNTENVTDSEHVDVDLIGAADAAWMHVCILFSGP